MRGGLKQLWHSWRCREFRPLQAKGDNRPATFEQKIEFHKSVALRTPNLYA